MAEQGKVDEVFVEIGARLTKLERDFKRAEKRAHRGGGEIGDGINKGLESKMGKIGKTLAIGVAAAFASAAAAAAVGTAALVKQQMQAIDAIAKTSDKIGVQTERLIEMDLAARRTGVATSTLTMALQRMVRRVSEAAQGSGEAKDAIKELGLDAQALARMAPDQQFRAIADAMQQVSSDGDRVRLAMRLFDSEGVALVNTLKGGTRQLDEFAQEARDLGLVMSRDAAAGVERANDALSAMQDAVGGAARSLTLVLAPAIQGIAENFADEVSAMRQILEEFKLLEGGGFGIGLEGQRTQLLKDINTLQNQARGLGPAPDLFFKTDDMDEQSAKLQVLLERLRKKQNELAEVNKLLEESRKAAEPPALAPQPGTGNLPGFGNALAALGPMLEHAQKIADQDARRLEISKNLHQSLREQTYTQRQLLEMELRMNGASDDFVNAQLAKYDALQNMIKGKREEAELDARAETLIDSIMTKEERLAKATEQINALKESGRISEEQAVKAIERQRKAIMGVAAAKRQAEGSATEGSLLSFGGALAAARNATQAAQRRMQAVGGAVANAGAGNQQQQQQAVRAATTQPVHDAKLFERVGEFIAAFNAKEFGGGFTA